MILQFSSAWCVQPSRETVKHLPSFQIVFGGKIEWFDHFNLKAMLLTVCVIIKSFHPGYSKNVRNSEKSDFPPILRPQSLRILSI